MKPFSEMTLKELDKHLRDNGVIEGSAITLKLDSGTRVVISIMPETYPIAPIPGALPVRPCNT